jgi:E3 Ubiquitin ligase
MGGLLLIVGLAVLGFGLMQHFKGKRILAAPFKKTGELAKNPVSEDPKGAMSTEGKVIAPATPLLSPATQQPCLAYELKIERMYEKTETTQDGTKTVKGTDTLDTIKGGTVFGLDDGSGAFNIDVSKGSDFDNMKEGFKKEINGHSGSSHITFGAYTYDVPAIGSDKGWTIGFKATEKYVPVEGSLFVLGKLEGASLVKPGWRSMMTSAKGREGLLGSIQKKKKFSFIGGGIAAVLSIPLMIFGPKSDPNAEGAYCPSELTDVRLRCHNQVTDEDLYTWTVTKPGPYELTVFAPAKKVAFDPGLIVTDSAGEEIANVEGGVGNNAKATVEVKAGTYKVKVFLADHFEVKGGYSYDMQIKSLAPEAPAPKNAKAPKAGKDLPVAAADPSTEEEVGEDAETEEAEDTGSGGYTAEELTNRVAELNDLCPDTFCEGSFNYDFKSIVCTDAKHCTLSFTAKSNEKPNLKPYEASVEVKGFTALSPDPDKEFVYEGSFDEKVGDALGKWEQHPKSVKPVAAPTATKKTPEAKPVVAKPEPKPVVAKPEPKPVVAEPKPEPKPVIVKAEPAPKPAPVVKAEPKPAPVAEQVVAPKPATVAAAPAPAPVVAPKVSTKKPVVSAPAPSTNRTSKNLED